MSSNTNPFGVPPPFGPPPSNNAAPAAAVPTTAAAAPESPSSIDSSLYADIDIIICGIKDDIGELLSSLQQYARKRGDGASVGHSVALDVGLHLQRQQDLDGCLRWIGEHGKGVEEMARRVFAGDASLWEEESDGECAGESEECVQREEGGDGAREEDAAGGQEMTADESESIAPDDDGEEFVASEEDITRMQWMQAHEAMEIVRRLGMLQDDLLRDLPLLSEEERANKCTKDSVMDDGHWSDVLQKRLEGGRWFWG